MMEDTLSAGNLLARRYRLIDQIGAGGMSVIWRARDEVLDRIVALKVLASDLAADQRFRDLVREEARNAAQLVHPHVTAIHDYGEEIAPDGTVTAFVVMELLTGESLERRLTAGPLPWPEALEVCAQIAEALAAAHRIGVVHRDVTPANIMLTDAGVKVLDFGIATRVGAPDEDEDGDTFGTPAYVSPERLDGTPTLPATDTYALGVLLYETLTGRVPFPALTWDDLARTPRHGQPPAPTFVKGLPHVVAELCRRCLSRSPLDRPTAHQVAAELRANIPGGDAAAVPARPAGANAAPPAERPHVPAPALPELPASVIGFPVPPALATTPSQGPGGPASPTFLPGNVAVPPAAVPSTADPAPATANAAPPPAGPARTVVASLRHGERSDPPVRRDRSWVRVTIATAAAVAALATAGVVASALGRPGETPRSDALAPSTGAPASAAPSGDRAPAQPGPTASAGPTRGAAPSPSRRPPTVGETIGAISQIIDAGVLANEIRPDAALDLRNVLQHLRDAIDRGVVNLAAEAANLQDKVATRRREGAITGGSAEQLDTELARLGRL
jgi:eukaryotic-like serine/threonine-protein kinase